MSTPYLHSLDEDRKLSDDKHSFADEIVRKNKEIRKEYRIIIQEKIDRKKDDKKPNDSRPQKKK